MSIFAYFSKCAIRVSSDASSGNPFCNKNKFHIKHTKDYMQTIFKFYKHLNLIQSTTQHKCHKRVVHYTYPYLQFTMQNLLTQENTFVDLSYRI